MNKTIIVLFLLLSVLKVNGQNTSMDSINIKVQEQNVSIDSTKNRKNIKYKSLIIPTALIGYGVVGLTSSTLKDINTSAKNDFRGYDDRKLNIDDFSQYSPFLSVYALNAMGIQGKNNFKDRTIVLATAYIIMGGSVNILKKTTNVTRPDGSSTNSFPSGHTATAFMGAEFLYQEYKDVSVWYGITGYVVAAGTGLFRIYNEKHWLTDVATGAGIGILSTKIAYWIHPLIKKTIFKDKEKTTGIVMPFYNGREYGLGLSLKF
ncbi:phosphatase PAP2 family protein [Galbibacter sp. EGI 63066]|uniref:phosphatase PAP2 family protein n=1 Tax=Galbibacter sp. EGI 63066 TaxID=2993559 RepID=UPI0022499EAC|nr:phosphatase PAP2 family protein [Galbibacter sp. EGI 63066]MCX2682089.1 phosphatase PAP2 family protein [Galbibacter sp. EGI 63066]